MQEIRDCNAKMQCLIANEGCSVVSAHMRRSMMSAPCLGFEMPTASPLSGLVAVGGSAGTKASTFKSFAGKHAE